MPKLHQILAIERDVTVDATRRVSLAVQGLGVTGEQSPLNGLSRVYEPRAEDGDRYPPESQQVQVKSEDVLQLIAKSLTRLLDVKLTREDANTRAAADVKVDGQTLIADAPVGYLLFLERQLADLKTLISGFPVLDPSQEWHWDSARGVYATEPKVTAKEGRQRKAQVLYEATKEHPAQVAAYEVTYPVGDWTLTRFSGALPAERRDLILDRLGRLIAAVKFAREEANSIDVHDPHAGAAIFGYLLEN